MSKGKIIQIDLKDIQPNRWRDVGLAPLDEDQVAKLVHSIQRFGLHPGAIVVRPVDQQYELVSGAHRLEAARRAKIQTAEVNVAPYNDTEAIAWMQHENADQVGDSPAAVLNEVHAATRLILGAMLKDGPDLGHLPLSLCFDNQSQLGRALTEVKSGEGLGWRVLTRFFGHGDTEKCPRRKHDITEALASLKATGLYDEVHKELGVEPNDDTVPAPARPRTKRQRKQPTFNRECIKLFDRPSHVAAFREVITSEIGLRTVSVDQQLALAKQMLRDLKKKPGYGVGTIRQYVRDYLKMGVRNQRRSDKRQKAENQLVVDSLHEKITLLRASFRSAMSQLTAVNTLLHKHPDLHDDPKLGGYMITLEEYHKALGIFLDQHNKPARRKFLTIEGGKQ